MFGNNLKKWILLLVVTGFLVSCSNNQKTITPKQGDLQQFFSETAKTQLSQNYVLTMPISGKLNPIELNPGDQIQKGQLLASLEAKPLILQIEQDKATITTVKRFIQSEQERLKSFEAELALNKKNLNRNAILVKKNHIEQSRYDDSLLAATKSELSIMQQKYTLASLMAVESITSTRLAKTQYDLSISKIESPVTGVILDRYTQGNAWLPAGQQLFSVGKFQDLEVVSEVLTSDAQQLKVGGEVLLGVDGVHYPFKAIVKRIDPAGFTKKSALGVDEQRVNVIIQPENPEKMNVKVGYRLFAKFITSVAKNVIIIPRYSMLQASDGSYYVLTQSFMGVKKRPIKIDIMTDSEVAVIDGLSTSDKIISEPTAQL